MKLKLGFKKLNSFVIYHDVLIVWMYVITNCGGNIFWKYAAVYICRKIDILNEYISLAMASQNLILILNSSDNEFLG